MYTSPKKFPARETEKATPISPYGFSKMLAEEAVAFYAKDAGFDFVILRYANVFGPRQNAHGESGIIAIFSELARRQKQPTIYRKQTTRDYVYVGDVARANVAALTRGTGEVINIGTGTETTNQQVFEAVVKAFKWQTEPRYEPARPGELQRSVLSYQKAKRLLGWEPTVDIPKGLSYIYTNHHA
jgi:UDP-glucose 4-epimerase